MLSKRLNLDAWNSFVGHIPSRRVRRWWLSRMLGSLGPDAFVAMDVTLMNPTGICLGPRVAINAHCILDGRGNSITVGEDSDIGTHSHVWTLEHDFNDPDHGTRSAPVVIEDHVWIASRVTILPGVTIGRGAVVGAGSVVTRNVGPLDIVAGVPAKVIGRRANSLTYRIRYNPRFR